MFTDKIPEFFLDLLPCKIGDTLYIITETFKTYRPATYIYELESVVCQGFVIERNNEIKLIPAEDTWDGWCPIYDYGNGYYTDKEEALKKIKELNEAEEFKEQNRLKGLYIWKN